MAQRRAAALFLDASLRVLVGNGPQICYWNQPFARFTSKLPRPPPGKRAIPNVQHVVLVGSGKGGVGKSTTAGADYNPLCPVLHARDTAKDYLVQA